jgi:hypothetical protein
LNCLNISMFEAIIQLFKTKIKNNILRLLDLLRVEKH